MLQLDTEEGAGLFVNVGLRGDETFEEFHKKMITVVREQSMFTGHETFENLSAEQCQTLIRHFERWDYLPRAKSSHVQESRRHSKVDTRATR